MPDSGSARDIRIDFLRGLALIMIFINHIPDTALSNYTTRNFGFSDGAEAFVLLSGISAGLAYSPFKRSRNSAVSSLRPWRRAFTLWWVQALIVLVITIMIALTRGLPNIVALAQVRNVAPVLQDPAEFLAPLLLLSHQYSCADILPLYVVLMLAAPILILGLRKFPLCLIILSFALWLVAGLKQINLLTWPISGEWFFSPFSWQMLFSFGLLTGMAKSRGRAIIPVRNFPILISIMYLCASAIWMLFPNIADQGYEYLWQLQERWGVPFFLVSFDKTYLAPFRLLHILSLAYLISALPGLTRASKHSALSWISILGRNALPVFATLTILAYVIEIARETLLLPGVMDFVLIGVGVNIMLLVALLRDRSRRRAGLGTVANGAKAAP